MNRMLLILGAVAFGAAIPFGIHSALGHHATRMERVTLRPTDPQNACGPVCVATVAAICGRPVPLADINAQMILAPSGACSLRDVKNALESFGIEVGGQRFTDRASSDACDKLMIVHMAFNHFATVLPIDDTRSVLIDPPRAPEVVTRRALATRWDGNALVIHGTSH